MGVSGEDAMDLKLGRTSIMEITILNDDEPGTFQFEKRGHLVKESCGNAVISVIRQNGADGDVTIKWRTVDKTAISGKDFVGGEGVNNETWAQQFKDAMVVNGGDIENATTGDYVMHFLTFGFKLIFAVIPPPGLLGGYPCFVISLAMIGMIVIVVGDLADIFGCIVGLHTDITAITFVALGTSLP